MALGIAAFLLYSLIARDRPKKVWLHLLVAGLGAATPILPLLIRNQLLMGAFWRTGYPLTNEQTGFSYEYFKEHAIDYIRHRRKDAPLFLLIVVTGEVLLTNGLKLIVHRDRPPVELRLTGASGWSFPSGHSAAASASVRPVSRVRYPSIS